jgi:hypothetical protein
MRLPKAGVYTFYTASDDGSRLHIGDTLVVDNDELHGIVEKSEQIALAAGLHSITVTYFNCTGGRELKVLYQGPGIDKQSIPASLLWHTTPANGDTPTETSLPTTQPGSSAPPLSMPRAGKAQQPLESAA